MKIILLSYFVLFYMNAVVPNITKIKVKDSITNEELTGVKVIVNDKDTLYSNFDGEIMYKGEVNKVQLNLVSYSDTIINYKSDDKIVKK